MINDFFNEVFIFQESLGDVREPGGGPTARIWCQSKDPAPAQCKISPRKPVFLHPAVVTHTPEAQLGNTAPFGKSFCIYYKIKVIMFAKRQG